MLHLFQILVLLDLKNWVTLDIRGETRALIGGGGEYSYLLVLPDEFLLKSAVIKVIISKEIRRAEHEYMNIHTPPPPIS